MSAFPFLHKLGATAFLFPGQGSQEVGMAADLVQRYPVAREAFAEADELLGFPLGALCFDGPEEVLTDTINAQPALLAASVALLRVLDQELASGPEQAGPVFVAGHSLGEYTALVAAGSLSYGDALRLVRTRGRLMLEAGLAQPGKMAAVLGLDAEAVQAVCAALEHQGYVVQIANDNCPGQLVISGDMPGIEQAMPLLQEAGARKIVPLAVSIASHSPLMAPAASALREAIEATPIAPPALPLIANTSARPIHTADEIRCELEAQLTGQVRWTASMRLALDAGATRFVEIGAGDVLTTLMKRIDRKVTRQAVSDVAGVQAFVASLAG